MAQDFLYNKQPFNATDDREEHFLIEVPGIFVPECDIVYYGLLQSEYSEELFKLREATVFDPREIYNDHMYFTGPHLIQYLASDSEELESCDADYLGHLYVTALNTYKYNPANETMIRHAIIEAAMYDFVKSVSLVYPWGAREIDIMYMSKILPTKVKKKLRYFSGSLMDAVKNRPDKIPFYTTILTNSIEDVNDMIDHASEYQTDQAFFLLRNHSENTSVSMVPDPDDPSKEIVQFDEEGSLEIMNKLFTPSGMQKGLMRFARFVPYLYSDRKPLNETFQFGI